MSQIVNYGDARLPERFWSKVVPEPNSGCWLFVGRLDPKGYGAFDLHERNGRRDYKKASVRSHRHAYENLVGAVENGLELDHRCRVRCCCNPAHLDPVTHKVNMERGAHAMKTHCPSGHAYTEDNVWRYNGQRYCKTCRSIRNASVPKDKKAAKARQQYKRKVERLGKFWLRT